MQINVDHFKINGTKNDDYLNVFLVLLGNNQINKLDIKNMPHKYFGDLYVLFQVDGNFIDNNWLKMKNLTQKQLFEIAIYNLKNNPNYQIMSVIGMINLGTTKTGYKNNLKELPNDKVLYVLTNKQSTLGASAMLDLDFLDEISNYLKSDLIIFPSSLHETMIVSLENLKKNNMNNEESIIKNLKINQININKTKTKKQDQLSDNVYRFVKETKEIFII